MSTASCGCPVRFSAKPPFIASTSMPSIGTRSDERPLVATGAGAAADNGASGVGDAGPVGAGLGTVAGSLDCAGAVVVATLSGGGAIVVSAGAEPAGCGGPYTRSHASTSTPAKK